MKGLLCIVLRCSQLKLTEATEGCGAAAHRRSQCLQSLEDDAAEAGTSVSPSSAAASFLTPFESSSSCCCCCCCCGCCLWRLRIVSPEVSLSSLRIGPPSKLTAPTTPSSPSLPSSTCVGKVEAASSAASAPAPAAVCASASAATAAPCDRRLASSSSSSIPASTASPACTAAAHSAACVSAAEWSSTAAIMLSTIKEASGCLERGTTKARSRPNVAQNKTVCESKSLPPRPITKGGDAVVAAAAGEMRSTARATNPATNPRMISTMQRPMVNTTFNPGSLITGSLNAHANVTPVYSSTTMCVSLDSGPSRTAPMVEGASKAWWASMGAQQNRSSSGMPQHTASMWYDASEAPLSSLAAPRRLRA
mmetsp:Transcript_77682/g.155584  ORF Transcript_77682/g.155584 Transcript_77682/m.155584 type:complete len:365 (-) Transcript_77682:130-1224(-)